MNYKVSDTSFNYQRFNTREPVQSLAIISGPGAIINRALKVFSFSEVRG